MLVKISPPIHEICKMSTRKNVNVVGTSFVAINNDVSLEEFISQSLKFKKLGIGQVLMPKEGDF
jgi:hypothetical protein